MEFEIKNGVLVKYTGNDSAVKIPEGVKRIGDKAFYRCKYLTKIVISDGDMLY